MGNVCTVWTDGLLHVDEHWDCQTAHWIVHKKLCTQKESKIRIRIKYTLKSIKKIKEIKEIKKSKKKKTQVPVLTGSIF